MKKTLLLIASAILSLSDYSQDLVILHSNDTHSQIEPERSPLTNVHHERPFAGCAVSVAVAKIVYQQQCIDDEPASQRSHENLHRHGMQLYVIGDADGYQT